MLKVSISDAFEHIEGEKAVKIDVPQKGKSSLPLECIVRPVELPHLTARFQPDELPADIDLDEECLIIFNIGGPSISINARIERVVSGRLLVLEAIEAYQHPQKREHFRIDVDVPVKYWYLTGDEEPKPLPALRKTVNLSGGGVMIGVSTPVSTGQKLGLELILPGPPRETIRCVGRVVRIIQRGENDLDVGLHFVEIDPDDQESIIAFGFAEQRKQLRDKVRVTGTA
jgi:hypothetical protein